jgi:hypothetical protein
MNLRYIITSLSLLLLCFTYADAQEKGTIRGVVKDKATGQPVLFLPLGLEGTTYGAQTDEGGYYTLSKLEPGRYVLIIKNFEFVEVRDTIDVKAGRVVNRNYLLEKAESIETGVVEISAEGTKRKDEINIGSETIRTKDIKRIPSVGGQADLAQYLQNLPGVITTGDQGGQLYCWME